MGKRDALEVYGTDYPTADGTAIRDYVHVADIAGAHLRALDVRLDGGGPVAFNLGTGTGRSVREVVEAARRVTGRPIPVVEKARRPGDPPKLVAAVTRAQTTLGWHAAHSNLEEILDSAWRWHQAHPHGYRGG
jgi:UDP-glucose 4-epimerase